MDDLNVSTETAGGGTLDINGTTGSQPTDLLLGSVTLTGSIIDSVGTGSISSVNAFGMRNGTVSATLTGSGGLTKTTTGTVTISKAASYGGATTINDGTLTYGVANALPATGVTVNANGTNLTATLNLNGFDGTIGSLTLGGTSQTSTSVAIVQTGAGVLTLGGNVTTNATGNPVTAPSISGKLNLGSADRTFTVANGSGSDVDLNVAAVVSGTGVGLIKAGDGTMLLGSANSYTGATTVNNGVLRYGINHAIDSSSVVTVNANAASTTATLDLNGFNGTVAGLNLGGAGQTASSVVVVQTGTGTLTLAGDVSSDATGDPTIAPLISGKLNLGSSNRTFTVADGSSLVDLEVSALISGSGGLIKTGAGILYLSNVANTYTGKTTVSQGILAIASEESLGPAPASFVADHLTLDGGTLGIAGNFQIDDPNRGVSFGATGSNVNVLPGATLGVGSSIAGTGGFTKDGTGTVILTGTNTYSGVTTVNEGTLLINGDNSGATGAVTVAAGATLGGDGIVGGATTINGVHSPGNSPDIQTFAAGLAYNTGAEFVWELIGNTNTLSDRGTFFDGVDVTGGTLSISSGATSSLVFNSVGSTVSWADSFWTSNRSWLVFTSSTPISGSTFGSIIASADSNSVAFSPTTVGAFAWRIAGSELYLDFTAVPEPTSLGGALVLLGLWAARRRPARRKLV
jgi:autotransporter-associated beta strand protein